MHATSAPVSCIYERSFAATAAVGAKVISTSSVRSPTSRSKAAEWLLQGSLRPSRRPSTLSGPGWA